MAGAARPWVLSRWVTHAALVAVVAAALATPASRASALPRAAASGTVACSSMTGTVTFSPPARDGGTSPEVQRYTLTLRHCVASGGTRVAGGAAVATVRRATNDCASIFSSAASSGTVAWSAGTVAPTRFTFSGYVRVDGPTGLKGFRVPGPGGRSRVTGSFAGADHGATSTATGYINLDAQEFLSECRSPFGMASHAVVAGSVRFG